MNEALFERYRNKLSPFDGSTIYIYTKNKRIGLIELSHYLNILVEFLIDHQLLQDDIFMCQDWIQHDGYISPVYKTTKENLLQIIHSKDSLYAGRAGDTYVYKGFYDLLYRWYLRIYIKEDYEHISSAYKKCRDRIGRFDITLSPTYADELYNYLNSKHLPNLQVKDGYQYFHDIIAGRENRYEMPQSLINKLISMDSKNSKS